jgi:indole-3-glycerol phosphate synthase
MKLPSYIRESTIAMTDARRRVCSAASIRKLARESQPSRNFRRVCQSCRLSAVCEVRSAGQARTAVARGCPALSVRTWQDRDLDLFAELADVCLATSVPTLQRDLIASEYQVWEARAFGADAVTLLPALVEPAELARFAALAEELGMTAVFEVYDEEDAEVAFDLGAQVTVAAGSDLATLRSIRDRLPPTLLVLAEAGGTMTLIGGELLQVTGEAA